MHKATFLFLPFFFICHVFTALSFLFVGFFCVSPNLVLPHSNLFLAVFDFSLQILECSWTVVVFWFRILIHFPCLLLRSLLCCVLFLFSGSLGLFSRKDSLRPFRLHGFLSLTNSAISHLPSESVSRSVHLNVDSVFCLIFLLVFVCIREVRFLCLGVLHFGIDCN